MQGFSRGEILKGRYPLAWWKVRCYECGGLGHKKKDHGEMKKMKRDEIGEDKKKGIVKEKDEIEIKKKDKKDKKGKKKKKKKIEKREIGIETEIVEEKEKRDAEIVTEKEIVENKREIELREQEKRVEKREKEVQEIEGKIREKFEEEIEEKEKDIKKKEEEMEKRVKRMVELESKIREREIEVKKREGEILRKEELEKRKEEDKRERLEKMRLEEERKKEEAKKIEREKEEKEKKIRLEKMKKKEEKKMLDEIVREQQKKMKEMMTQIKAMTKKVKTPTMFFRVSWKVESFVKECREYVEMKMKEKTVEDQILWVLTCIDRGTVEKWKEMMEDNLKEGLREYVTLEEFFEEIRKEFGRKGKGKKTEEEIEKGINGFWNVVKGKEVEVVKKKPKVEAMMPRIPAVGRGSGFWKR